jgi:hypothetical protein
MSERFPSRLGLLILAITLAVIFHRLFLGEVFFWGLPALQFYPWREFAFDMLRNGQLPLWNPYNGAGAPLIANYQSALFYPLNWFGFFLPLGLTMSVTAVLHLFIGGWGMWAFTGRLKIPAFGRCVSALAFGLTGYLVGRLGTYPTISVAAWLPWLLWAVHRILTQGKLQDMALFALFAALQLLAGHAQTTWYSMLLMSVFAAYWLVRYERLHWRRAILAVGAMALAVGIALAQLLPTAELLSQSQRSSGVDYAFAMNYSYGPLRVFNFFSPNAFGNPGDGSYATKGAFFEDAVYIGLIPLLAAFAAFFGWIARRKDENRPPYYNDVPFWWLIVLVGFVLALGEHSPIFPFLYQNVPTFDVFQAPVRWHLWTVFALSVLAGIGVQSWGKGKWRIFWTRLATAGFTFGAVVAMFAIPRFMPALLEGENSVAFLINAIVSTAIIGAIAGVLTLLQPEKGTRWEGWHDAWAALVLIVIVLDLGWAAWGLNPTVPNEFYDRGQAEGERYYWTEEAARTVQYEQFLPFDDYHIATENWQTFRVSHLPNLNLLDRSDLLNNFDPLLIDGYKQFTTFVDENPSQSARLLEAAGVSGVYDASGELEIVNNDTPRAWLVAAACWHPDEDSLTQAMLSPDWQPSQQIHLLGDGSCADATDDIQGTVDVVEAGANAVELQVNAYRDNWLVLADAHYPGWVATVDGEETYIYRTNLMFRAIQVSAGEHTVRFEYRPVWLFPGIFVSVVSALGLLLLFRLRSELQID